MYGIQIAWKDYSPRRGIWGSEWVGWVNFTKFFKYYRWPNIVWNTLAISLYQLAAGFPIPIALALMLHVYTGKALKKVIQNVSYVPHFISMVVMIGIINTVLNPVSGFIGYINRITGNLAYEDIRGNKHAFRHLYVWSGIWQGCGYGSILYLSALSAVPEELHEAAKIDGASRLRRVFAIDLPTLMPLVALKLIMNFGGIMSVGWQKAFLMQNSMNTDTSELISTYVYKNGIRAGAMSFGTAVGLLQSFINTSLVFIVNSICNLLTDNEMGLF
jgi:putative aldouronate transport system permease protein